MERLRSETPMSKEYFGVSQEIQHRGLHDGRTSTRCVPLEVHKLDRSAESGCEKECPLGRYYDVIVVGAGPAGLIVGEQLKDKGLDVLVIEKKQKVTPTVEYIVFDPDIEALRDQGFDLSQDGDGRSFTGTDADLVLNPMRSFVLNIGTEARFSTADLGCPHYNLDSNVLMEKLRQRYLESGGDLSLGTEYLDKTDMSDSSNQGNLEVRMRSASEEKTARCKLLIDATGNLSDVQDYPQPHQVIPIVGGIVKFNEPLPRALNSWFPIIDGDGRFSNSTLYIGLDKEVYENQQEKEKLTDINGRPLLSGWWVSPLSKDEAVVYLWGVGHIGLVNMDRFKLQKFVHQFGYYLPRIFDKTQIRDIGTIGTFSEGFITSGNPFKVTRSCEDFVYAVGAAAQDNDWNTNQNTANMLRLTPILVEGLHQALQEDRLKQEDLNGIQGRGHPLLKVRAGLNIGYPIYISHDPYIWSGVVKCLSSIPPEFMRGIFVKDMDLPSSPFVSAGKVAELFRGVPEALPYFLPDDRISRWILSLVGQKPPKRLYEPKYTLWQTLANTAKTIYHTCRA
jgi:hypothetical protein